MQKKKTSVWTWVSRFFFFGVLPAVTVVILGVTVNQFIRVFGQQVTEQNLYDARRESYQQMAQQIEMNVQVTEPETADEVTPEATEVSILPILYKPRETGFEQDFSTNTPQPLTLATNTPVPQMEPTLDLASAGTPRPLPTFFSYGNAPPEGAIAATAIPTAVPQLDRRGQDLMNIVLLGNDGELTGDGFIRTDTIMIVSINRTAGTVAMLTLPRDMYVYIPGWTMQRLNLAYIHGEAGGWTDGGFGLLRNTLMYNFGINVHYYAMVNLTGFKAMVDAVGGVRINVDCAIQNLPLLEAEVPAEAIRVNEDGDYVLPVGSYFMNGAEALWYARARDNNSDFDRGFRQQQIVRGVWRQAVENGLIGQIPQLWTETIPYVETNLTVEDIIGLAPLAASIDSASIENFALVRTYHTTPWQTPDGDYVQLPVYETLRPILEDFYTPPTESQINVEGASVAVYNGSSIENFDQVAAQRLAWEGINAFAMGPADQTDLTQSLLIDYNGSSKGSSLELIARTLNVLPENIQIDPQAEREYDFQVILGSDFTSCPANRGVLPVEMPTDTP